MKKPMLTALSLLTCLSAASCNNNQTPKEVPDFVWDGKTIPQDFDLRNVDCDGDESFRPRDRS